MTMTPEKPFLDLLSFFQKPPPFPVGEREYNAAFCRLLIDAAETDEASIWQVDTDNQLRLAYSTDIPQRQTSDFVLHEGEGIGGAVALSRRTISVADAWQEPSHNRKVDQSTSLRTRSMLSAPILFQGTLHGVLNILNLASPRAIPQSWHELLPVVATVYAAALAQGGRLKRAAAGPAAHTKRNKKHSPHTSKTAVVGISPAIQTALHLCLKAGSSDIPVLVRGETGTGKELAARRIHDAGNRAEGPFLAVNCASLTETILESELFGHVKGAFTGALNNRQGKFVAANGGTLFLDEIGEMSLTSQAKILRALEEKKVTPVGSEKAVPFDVRIIAATNRELSYLMTQLKFREDLYYRLCGIEIIMPPLRERLGDIPLLAAHFLKKSAAPAAFGEDGRPPLQLSPEALELLPAYSWPGNVRQLEQAVLAAVALCEDEQIKPSHFPPWLRKAMKGREAGRQRPSSPAQSESSNAERDRYLDVLNATRYAGTGRWNLAAAARQMNMPRKTFAYRLKKLGIV